MRNYSFIIFCVVAVFLTVVYIGGALPIGGAPIFYHLDKKLGTTALMGTHYKVMSLFRKREQPKKEEDMWTKSYQDFNKVLKNTVE